MSDNSSLITKLKQNGFVYPQETLNARTVAKLGLPLACALLMLETGGGANVFGHDVDTLGKCPGWGWGEVTEAKYKAFLSIRRSTGRSNGVGPAQLTSPFLQDQADLVGGCWIPQHNMAVGFHYLHDLIVEHKGVLPGCVAYNGAGAAAHAYGAHLVSLANHYVSIGLGSVVNVLDTPV